MPRRKLTDFLTYRWRYPLAYIVFGVALATLLAVAGLFIPGGLSENEIQSALISNSLSLGGLFSLKPEELIFLPYRLLQAASISIFGFTSFSIKLPSIVLALVSAGGMLLLLNTWFRKNVAIITALLAVTTSQFLLMAQSGNPGVTYIFWTVAMLLAASYMTKRGTLPTLWILLGFVLAGLSLYMPLNIYVVLALLLTALFHPHARHVVLRVARKPVLVVGGILFLAIISPLIYSAVSSPIIVYQLLGVPQDWSQVSENARTLLIQYGSFAKPSSGAVITPVYGLGTALLIVLGLFRMFSTKYTTKSYIISFWLVLLLPFVFLNPSFISVTFVPVVLLMGLGIEYLVWSWYRLFPHNPYARIFGLLPLGVLVFGMTLANINRYVYGYHYDKAVYSDYSFDLETLDRHVRSLDESTTAQIVSTKEDRAFYSAYAEHQEYIAELKVTSTPKNIDEAKTVIYDHTSAQKNLDIPDKILVDATSRNADRFYVYTPDEN